jgi:metal-sulfur cluster biosynthetic enzyme
VTPARTGTAPGWAEAPAVRGVAAADGGEARVDLAGAVMAALAGVRDPELDEPVTELGFVDSLIVSGGRVEVSLRLPTYFCAPNFVWLMVDDAHAALRAIPGVREVLVRLVDHFAADEINAGLQVGQGFEATFAGLADGELDELRDTFRRKALAARQDRLCRMLLAAGATPGDLAERRVGDLPPGPDTDTYLQRRAELGIDVSPEAPFLVDRTGAPVSPERVSPYLRRLRTVAVSIEGNAGFCRGLLATRYPTGPQPGLQPAQRGGGDR